VGLYAGLGRLCRRAASAVQTRCLAGAALARTHPGTRARGGVTCLSLACGSALSLPVHACIRQGARCLPGAASHDPLGPASAAAPPSMHLCRTALSPCGDGCAGNAGAGGRAPGLAGRPEDPGPAALLAHARPRVRRAHAGHPVRRQHRCAAWTGSPWHGNGAAIARLCDNVLEDSRACTCPCALAARAGRHVGMLMRPSAVHTFRESVAGCGFP